MSNIIPFPTCAETPDIEVQKQLVIVLPDDSVIRVFADGPTTKDYIERVRAVLADYSEWEAAHE